MTKKLFLGLQTVEDGGLLIHDKVYPEKQYVFVDPRSFYAWLCKQMGVNAKPDSHTFDGRVVTSGHKLEKLERLHKAAVKYAKTQNDMDLIVAVYDLTEGPL